MPDTLITTSPDRALAFLAHHGTVIYKSMSGVRSVVSRLTERHLARIDEVENCPTMFQQFIAGVDVRVHVVGAQVFACQIESSAVDYRYPSEGEMTRVGAVNLPEEVHARCLAASRALSLPLCGIDLRRTPEGRWYAFEVNPSPAFTCFEVGREIRDAIAAYLTRP